MSEWINVIAKRELDEDEIQKILGPLLNRRAKRKLKEQGIINNPKKITPQEQNAMITPTDRLLNEAEESVQRLNQPQNARPAPELPTPYENVQSAPELAKPPAFTQRKPSSLFTPKKPSSLFTPKKQPPQPPQKQTEATTVPLPETSQTPQKKKQDAIRQLNEKIKQEQQTVVEGNQSEIQRQRQDKQKNIQALQNKLKEIQAIQV